jgi:hypothetical protein
VSSICGFIAFIKFEFFSVIIFWNIFSCPHFVSFPLEIPVTCVLLGCVKSSFRTLILCSFFISVFFLCVFHLGWFLLPCLPVH